MKRLLRFVLLALVALAFVIGSAEAKTTKQKKTKKPVTVDMTQEPADGDAKPAPQGDRERKQVETQPGPVVAKPGPIPVGPPVESQLKRASSKKLDLRFLPRTPPVQQERAEMPAPVTTPVLVQGTVAPPSPDLPVGPTSPSAPAPPPLNVYEGLDRFNWGAGSPPDTNGDVGPNDYIQTVNTSIGVFRKSDGFQEAAFTFNTFMAQGNFGNLCDTNNFGDPVVLYDTFEDRWIITDFAFLTDGGGNPIAPAYQCFAASMSGDPVSGGWNFYSIQLTDFFNDYDKLAIWPDGLYMSANMFPFGGGSFQKARVWAFNKAQMYAGSPTVKVVSFDVGGGDFTAIPSNARLQTGTPPAGRPNFFMSTQLFLNAVTVYKFHVDWDHVSLSTFTGPDIPISSTSWPTFAAAIPQPGTAQTVDSLSNRAMVQNQYTNFGGTESLWVSHTVRRQNTSGFAAPRWYQVNVTGGNVNLSIPQAATWDPDGANVIHRWMPSVALDRTGNLAMGYSTSNATTEFPSIKYAGRLAADPVNTFSKTEQTFFAGTASQTSSTRWGDYSAMTLDPDGCTFWYTTEYANPADQTFNHRWLTKFGSFRFAECTPVGAGGTISGTVTTNPGGNPIAGATVALGARSATTDGSGNYSFSIPAGTYPSMTASKASFVPGSASSIAVTDGNTTTQNFSLSAAPTNACLTDTTQSDFQTGVPTNVDLTASPGDVVLSNAPTIDQQNTAGTSTGTGFGTPAWTGQTFIAAVNGSIVKADIQLFCSGCGATPPNLTLSVRATSGGLPTGADLTTATVPGSAFASGSITLYTATFVTPVVLTSGTQYALILRPVSAPAGSGYFWVRSSPSTYANGSRVLSADSGGTWSADTTRDYNFKTYMSTGYASTGNLTSSPKDANPAAGITPIWQTLTWNGTAPANTSIKFQVAGSNNVNGPFNFVGPDNTAGTFFTTSPAQLSPQFYNLRYIEYKAILSTTDPNVTPTLNDVTACFADVDCSAPISITPGAAQACPNSTGNTASGPGGETSYQWSITNGTITSSATIQTVTFTAGASGNVHLTLNVVEPSGCLKNTATDIPIDVVTQPTATPGGPTTFCSPGSVTLTSSSATGNQWYLNGNPIGGETNQTYIATASGDYTVIVSDGTCPSLPSSPVTVVVNTTPPTPTINASTNGTGTQNQACPEQPLTLTATGATGATSYQWYKGNTLLNGETNQTYQATAAATYFVTATANGCTTAQSAGYVVQDPTPATPTISANGSTAICGGGSVTLHSDLTGGIQWWLNGVPLEDANAHNQDYPATVGGTYKVQLNALGCHSAFSNDIIVTVSQMPTTPTVAGATNGTGTQDQACPEQPLTLTATSTGADSYQWYSDNAPIGNGTNQLTVTAAGNYSVTAISGACTTPHSATYVVFNPTPHSPFISVIGTSTTICNGGSVLLASDSATGIQWYKDNVAIPGANSQQYLATAAGSYTAILNALGCHSAVSNSVVLTAGAGQAPNATITAPATVLTNSSNNAASVPDAGAGATYSWNGIAGQITSGQGTRSITFKFSSNGVHALSVDITLPSGCTTTNSVNVNSVATMAATHFAVSAPATVTAGTAFSVVVTALDATNSPVTNYAGTVHFTSSSAGTLPPDTAFAGAADNGSHSFNVTLTTVGPQTLSVTDGTNNGSANITVQCPVIDATITAPTNVVTGSTGNIASVANAGAGAAYNWSITNGTITAGAGTNSITFTAGAVGTLTLNVTVTKFGCSDSKAANVNVTVPPVTVTSITPANGPYLGGQAVTIGGTGFQTGATVSLGGAAATNVVRVSATQITAKTGAHAGGTVNVVVTNPDTSSGTLTNGYTYRPRQFDANGDNSVDPSDIFYLISYLYMHGNAPMGSAGMLSGDANGDGVVDPADIFYIVNYLFSNGPQPYEVVPGGASTLAVRNDDANRVAGSITLGRATRRGDHFVVPVMITRAANSAMPHAIALNLKFAGADDATIHRAGAAKNANPTFEATRRTDDGLTYIATYDASLAFDGSAVVAEIELSHAVGRIDVDPKLTMLSDQGGTHNATVSNGALKVSGTAVKAPSSNTPEREN